MTVLFVVLILAACALLYLSHRHQGWLAQPLPSKPWRALGALLLLAALACAFLCFSALTAVLVWLTMPMLVFGILPFFSLLIPRGERGQS